MAVIWYSFFLLANMAIFFVGYSCSPDDVKKLAETNNELALRLYYKLALQSKENLFFSPLSLSTAFGMLYYGTKGKTAEELRTILGYEANHLPEKVVHQTFNYYLTQKLPSQDSNDYVLSLANAALLDKNFDVLPSYRKDIQHYYQAMIKEVDFRTENQKVVKEINEWAKNKTNGMIDKVVNVLDPSSVLFLINAAYFKGVWKTKFEKSETQRRKFYNYGTPSETKEVPMMRMTGEFPYMANDELEVIKLPYKGENLSMFILLPRQRNGLEALQKDLTFEKFEKIRSMLLKTKLFLKFPKFKAKYAKEMSTDFKALGLHSVFSPDADFSGITKKKAIYVSQILHKAIIEVNEEGSEASSITGMSFVPMSADYPAYPKVIMDHPFLFAILDTRNDMIVFVGRVTNF